MKISWFFKAEKKDSSSASSTDDTTTEGAQSASTDELTALLKRSEELLQKAEGDNKKLAEERDEMLDKYKRSLGSYHLSCIHISTSYELWLRTISL